MGWPFLDGLQRKKNQVGMVVNLLREQSRMHQSPKVEGRSLGSVCVELLDGLMVSFGPEESHHRGDWRAGNPSRSMRKRCTSWTTLRRLIQVGSGFEQREEG